MHLLPTEPARRRRRRGIAALAATLVAPTLAAVVPIAAQPAAAAPSSITIVGDSAAALGSGTADDRSVYSFSTGSNFDKIRQELLNTANFGPNGTVKTTINIGPGISSPTALAGSGAQVYVTAARSNFSAGEVTALQNFVRNGGAVVLLGNSPTNNGTGYNANTGADEGTRTVISDPTSAITGFSMPGSVTYDNYCVYNTSTGSEIKAAFLIGPDGGSGYLSRNVAAGANNAVLDGPFGSDLASVNVWHTVGTVNVPANATRLLDVNIPPTTWPGGTNIDCPAAADPPGATTGHAAGKGSWKFGSWAALSGAMLAVQNAGVNGLGSGPVVVAGDVDLISNAYNTDLTDGTSRLGKNIFSWIISQLPEQTRFTKVTPARIYDTRGTNNPLSNTEIRSIQITGNGGVPAGAKAVAVNMTVVDPTQTGYLTVYPSGGSLPSSSNLNFYAGITVPNFVVAPLGADGKINVFNSAGTSQLLIDVVGYYGTSGDGMTSITPKRIMDTRTGTGGKTGPIAGGGTHTLQVTGPSSGVPANASAVMVNITATNPTATGYLTAWPSDQASQPVVSNVNFYAGITTPNFAIVPLSADGKINVFNSAGSTDVLVDVLGYLSPAGGSYQSVNPARILDARGGSAARFASGEVRTVQVGGQGGIPLGATAVVLNLTATDPTANSYLTAFPGNAATPDSSNVNFYAGYTKPNLVVVALPADGTIKILNAAGQTGVLVDVMGYVLPTA